MGLVPPAWRRRSACPRRRRCCSRPRVPWVGSGQRAWLSANAGTAFADSPPSAVPPPQQAPFRSRLEPGGLRRRHTRSTAESPTRATGTASSRRAANCSSASRGSPLVNGFGGARGRAELIRPSGPHGCQLASAVDWARYSPGRQSLDRTSDRPGANEDAPNGPWRRKAATLSSGEHIPLALRANLRKWRPRHRSCS